MTAIERTAALVRTNVKIDLIDAAEYNPNEMSEAEFNLLYDNMEKVGFVDPVFLRPLPNGRYKLIGGHHRLEVAKLHGFEEAPATIIMDPDFDLDMEKFQNVRMNMIRGKINPKKFLALYQSLDKKYANDVMAEAFGFADQDQFDKMVGQMAKTLPSEMQGQFKQAAKEIKTIDGLSKLLNSMFSRFGNTLDYGYMVLDYGGKDSIWLRMSSETRKAVLALGKRCMNENRTMDDLLGGVVQQMASGKLEGVLTEIVSSTPEVKATSELPTYEGVTSVV